MPSRRRARPREHAVVSCGGVARRRPIVRALKWTALGLGALSLVCAVRAATVTAPQVDPGRAPSVPEVAVDEVARALADAIAIPTVSRSTGGTPAAFEQLHGLLRARFPQVHERLERVPVGNAAVLYHWRGRDPSAPALVLAGHLDVVPVEPGTEADWTHPPFSGAIADGFVWGRGALDDKLSVITLLAAVESLLSAGHEPACDVWLAFGDDEEVGGREGAQVLASWLVEDGVKAQFVLDEGGAVIEGILPGVVAPVALVGIAEKGVASFELTLRAEGGHSSMPPTHGAIGRLAAAITRLEGEQMPGELRGAASAMIDRLTPEMGFAARLALANRWLLDPLIVRALARHPASNAIVRTTTAPTIFEAGSADNVLAANARAIVNFRVLPGDTVADVEAHIRDVVDDDEIAVRCVDRCWDPSPTSPMQGPGWDHLQSAIAWIWPEAIFSPSLVVGATDARYYTGLTDRVYRFLPIRMNDVDRRRLHGTDERVAVDDIGRAVRFYQSVVVTATR